MALVTPLVCWKTPCTPQKQPPEKTAVSVPLAAASGSSFTGGGTTFACSAEASRHMPDIGTRIATAATAKAAASHVRCGVEELSRVCIGILPKSRRLCGRTGLDLEEGE